MTDQKFKFIECDTCRKKPGSPTLCYGCFHNRELISKLNESLLNIKNGLVNVDVKYFDTNDREMAENIKHMMTEAIINYFKDTFNI